MKDFHGIIFAYNTFPELRELVKSRTAASLRSAAATAL